MRSLTELIKVLVWPLKAIVRWIAAQPLYNGGLRDAEGNPTGISPLGDNDTRVGAQEYKEYKPERWLKCVKGCRRIYGDR